MVPYCTVPCRTVRYSTIEYTLYTTVQYRTVRYGTVKYNTVRYVRYGGIQNGTSNRSSDRTSDRDIFCGVKRRQTDQHNSQSLPDYVTSHVTQKSEPSRPRPLSFPTPSSRTTNYLPHGPLIWDFRGESDKLQASSRTGIDGRHLSF